MPDEHGGRSTRKTRGRWGEVIWLLLALCFKDNSRGRGLILECDEETARKNADETFEFLMSLTPPAKG